MKSENQKLKLLEILNILCTKTDEDHFLSTQELIDALASRDIPVERKTLYSDIECLIDFGFDIIIEKRKSNFYAMGSRELELSELKLLVDSVQASKYITHKKSIELIKKLEKFTSEHNARQLQRQVFVAERIKTNNEQIYYNIDAINQALSQSKKISFKYSQWNLNKESEFRRGGESYIENPLGLAIADNNYYLISYSDKHKKIVHFRVDKMSSISVLEEKAEKHNINIAEYTNKTFNMYGGENEFAEIIFHNSLINVVLDRFGSGITIHKVDGEHFKAVLNVASSPVFLGWLMSFGNKAKVIAPQSLVDEIKKITKEILDLY